MPRLEFWYDFASSYSYLSAMRIEQLVAEAGIELVWRPFLLGPIFKMQGWNTSPFILYPAKGSHMVRDIERIACDRGLPFNMPDPFPAHSLHAARLAIVGEEKGWTPRFTKMVYGAEFGRGKDIASKSTLSAILAELDVGTFETLDASTDPLVKDRLRDRSDEAARRGIFGAPSFFTDDGELFWGDDRLEQALSWAAGCR